MGTIDMALVGNAVLANFDPRFSIFDLPFLFDSREHGHAVFKSDYCAQLYEGLPEYDIVGLAWYENGFFDVISKEYIDVPADMAGMNIRTMENNVYMGVYTAAGANPVPMAFNEVYTALQNNTIDGVSTSITAAVPMKFYEVAPYFCTVDMQYVVVNLIFSKEIFDEMPAEYQELLLECAEESAVYEWDKIVEKEEEGKAAFAEAGGGWHITSDRQAWIDAIQDTVWADSGYTQEQIDEIRNIK